jgi:sarcosine oxidase
MPRVESVEVAIVGAGVMGAATAWRLARRGREALLLERFAVGHDRGSSHGPTRIFRFAYGDPFYVRMAQEALPLWRELEREAGEALLDLTGGIDVGPPDALAPVARALEECGAASERIDDPAAHFPGIRTPHPALFSPDTGVLAAAGSVHAMVRLATAETVALREGEVARIESADDGRAVVAVGDERVTARSCVVAAGAWTEQALAPHRVRLPLAVSREQIVYARQRADFPVIVDRSRPRFLFGLPARFGAAGARFGHHKTGPLVSAGEPPQQDSDAVRRIVEFVGSAVPAVDPEPMATETCLYTSTPDDDFVLDRIGGLVVASPCSGHGFKFAPLIGEVLARLALGEEPGMDLSRFRVARF